MWHKLSGIRVHTGRLDYHCGLFLLIKRRDTGGPSELLQKTGVVSVMNLPVDIPKGKDVVK